MRRRRYSDLAEEGERLHVQFHLSGRVPAGGEPRLTGPVDGRRAA